jgi:hypothetical protein
MIRTLIVMARHASCLALLALGTACGDGTGPSIPFEGAYDLRTVDGEAVPMILSTGDSLLSAEMVIRDDESFAITPRYRRDAGTPWTTSIIGTLVRTGNDLSYVGATAGEIATGEVTNGHVTFEQGGRVFRFQHR